MTEQVSFALQLAATSILVVFCTLALIYGVIVAITKTSPYINSFGNDNEIKKSVDKYHSNCDFMNHKLVAIISAVAFHNENLKNKLLNGSSKRNVNDNNWALLSDNEIWEEM